MQLTPEEQEKQEYYRDARTGGYYGDIWKNVGKCVFCDMREKYIFFEENGVVMTIQLYAYIDGHIMIIPRRHVRSVKELTPEEWETMRKMMYMAKKLIRKVHAIKGMQIIQKDGADAQSTVEHLHFQCVPFDAPDLSIWNYRKLKNTPLENAELYRAQQKKIATLAKKFEEKYKGDEGAA
jgi:diadenosine tetraphosphate (Ap4A) HIT family hydrolase